MKVIHSPTNPRVSLSPLLPALLSLHLLPSSQPPTSHPHQWPRLLQELPTNIMYSQHCRLWTGPALTTSMDSHFFGDSQFPLWTILAIDHPVAASNHSKISISSLQTYPDLCRLCLCHVFRRRLIFSPSEFLTVAVIFCQEMASITSLPWTLPSLD